MFLFLDHMSEEATRLITYHSSRYLRFSSRSYNGQDAHLKIPLSYSLEFPDLRDDRIYIARDSQHSDGTNPESPDTLPMACWLLLVLKFSMTIQCRYEREAKSQPRMG